jgi:hypothetical protein
MQLLMCCWLFALLVIWPDAQQNKCRIARRVREGRYNMRQTKLKAGEIVKPDLDASCRSGSTGPYLFSPHFKNHGELNKLDSWLDKLRAVDNWILLYKSET